MKLKNLKAGFLFLLFLPGLVLAQKENVDLGMVYKIKQEGSRGNSLEEMAYGLTDFVGPRLTGSAGLDRGNEWAKKKMEEIGLQNVRIEEAMDFTRGGWENVKAYAAMTAPYYTNFACNPVAWTGSTAGLVQGDVVIVNPQNDAELEKYRGTLKGKIVLMPSTTTYELSFDPYATRLTEEELKNLEMAPAPSQGRRPAGDMANMQSQASMRNKINELLRSEGVAVIINSSGVFNVPRSTGANYRSGDPEPIAQLGLPVEAHARMERLLRHNVPVKMEVEIKNKFTPGAKVYNVIGEIPGTDKLLKNEVVLLGGHIDSWHGGTGAADNASGCIVMLEAVRILKSIEAAPKRTIRVALWGGEEQGLYGSQSYVSKYLYDQQARTRKPDWDKFAAYFNMDNGSGKYRGVYLQQNELVRPIFEEWLAPFAPMGCSTLAIRNTSGTDHLSFDRAGLPGFQFIQDDLEYDRGYHTVMDTYERLVMADLRHNAIITAAFAYFAAQRDAKLPGKPEMKQVVVQGRPMQ
jgi:Zn-dependent M28 family amino/carboxypeptidase